MESFSQQQLDRVIKLHMHFLKGVRGGVRATLKFKDLSGLHFRHANLSQADFTGCKLNDANLSRATFAACSFFCCELVRANMANGDFSRADFRGANITGANLTGAAFTSADLRQGVYIDYTSSEADKGWGKGGKTSFAGTVARDTDMTGVMARGSDFSHANLTGVIVRDAELADSDFTGANLSATNFAGSDMVRTNLKDAVLNGTDFSDVNTQQSNIAETLSNQKEMKSLDYDGLTIEQVVASHEHWINTAGREGKQFNLQDYDLSRQSTLRDQSLTAIIAKGCKFTGLNLSGVRMQSSLLDETDFQDCVGQQADMRGSSCKNAIFTRSDFRHADFSALKLDRDDGEDHWKPCDFTGSRMAFGRFDKTNFRGATLKNVDFTHASLRGCNFRDADLEGAIFENASLEGAKFPGTIMEGQEVPSEEEKKAAAKKKAAQKKAAAAKQADGQQSDGQQADGQGDGQKKKSAAEEMAARKKQKQEAAAKGESGKAEDSAKSSARGK